MSRSWYLVGLIALSSALSFAGCTVTTDNGDGFGGSGGIAGEAGGGSGGAAGEGGEGGTTTAKGGTTSTGGTTSAGGTTATTTTTPAVTFEQAVERICSVNEVAECLEGNCPVEYNLVNGNAPNCTEKLTAMLVCIENSDTSSITCDAKTVSSKDCATEENAYLDCVIQ
jgi:hypothetical protein